MEGLLREDVLRAVEGLSIGRDNYQNALDILEERFGTKNIIVSSVMDTLVSLTRVRDNDLKSLRKLYDSLEIGIRNLENMNNFTRILWKSFSAHSQEKTTSGAEFDYKQGKHDGKSE